MGEVWQGLEHRLCEDASFPQERKETHWLHWLPSPETQTGLGAGVRRLDEP